MNKEINLLYEEESLIFKALSHPTRLFIVNAINTKRLSVMELTEMAAIDISTMSKHLSILRKSGIIKGEKENNKVFYRLEIPCILDFMVCAKKVLHHQNQ